MPDDGAGTAKDTEVGADREELEDTRVVAGSGRIEDDVGSLAVVTVGTSKADTEAGAGCETVEEN